MLNYGPEPKA